jgi:hypothetical protein
VQPVGQLHQQHADVARNRDQQLAEILGLLGTLADEIQLLDLGKALDQIADFLAEKPVDLGARGVGILDRVMEKRRGDCRVVKLIFGECSSSRSRRCVSGKKIPPPSLLVH